jgi:hypothetical protein
MSGAVPSRAYVLVTAPLESEWMRSDRGVRPELRSRCLNRDAPGLVRNNQQGMLFALLRPLFNRD